MALQPYNFEPTVDDLGRDFQPQFLNSSSVVELNVNGRSKVSKINWCTCEKCCIFENDIECVCCAEFEKNISLRMGNKCITESNLFKKIVLDEEILNITRHQMILKTKNKFKKKKLIMPILSNSSWRFICYTQYTHWINAWSSLGKGTFYSQFKGYLKIILHLSSHLPY